MQYNAGADNLSGFTGMGAGFRIGGGFISLLDFGYFWSSSPSGGDAWSRVLGYVIAGVNRSTSNRRIGFAIRCARD